MSKVKIDQFKNKGAACGTVWNNYDHYYVTRSLYKANTCELLRTSNVDMPKTSKHRAIKRLRDWLRYNR